MMRLKMAEKVILTFKRLMFRKRIMTTIVVDHVMRNYIFSKSWDVINKKKIQNISVYLRAFLVRKKDQPKIQRALINEKNVMGTKCLANLESYMKSAHARMSFQKRWRSLVKIQSLIKAAILGKKYRRLREKAIIIQRAYRDYVFRKKGAKTLFETTYKWYSDRLLNQN